jgi:alpha-glucoside PTS system EIICB component
MGNHWDVYLAQIVIGVAFTVIYFFLFRWLIVKFDFALPGREKDDNQETKLYTKADYRAEKEGGKAEPAAFASDYDRRAAAFLEGLGGVDNITDVTNCATRLRVTVKDPEQVKDSDYFKKQRGSTRTRAERPEHSGHRRAVRASGKRFY